MTATSDDRRHAFNLQVAAVEAGTLKRELMAPDGNAVSEAPTAILPLAPTDATASVVTRPNDGDGQAG